MDFKLLILVLACVHFSSSAEISSVNLTYLYETKCPYCAMFTKSQFYPGYQKVGQYINLQLIPVVIVEADVGSISCQHGENECYVSRAQACAYKESLTQDEAVEYLHCTEEHAPDDEITEDMIKQCTDTVVPQKVSWDAQKQCIDSSESSELLKSYYRLKKQYQSTYVPWLIINGVHDEDLENAARSDFVKTICDLLNNAPSECSS